MAQRQITIVSWNVNGIRAADWGAARTRNIGWRLDYIFVSSRLKDTIVAAEIHTDVLGSDHCPISLTLALP